MQPKRGWTPWSGSAAAVFPGDSASGSRSPGHSFTDPSILILDEATTGLDQVTEWSICTHIRELCATTGVTVLAVSHQYAWQQAAHHVYRIEAGHALPTTAPVRSQPDLAGTAA